MFKRHSKSTASGLFSTLVVTAALGAAAQAGSQQEKQMAQHPYVGLWVTDDGRVRHELLANGRYDEARTMDAATVVNIPNSPRGMIDERRSKRTGRARTA